MATSLLQRMIDRIPNIVGLWALDDAQGSQAVDSVGGHDATASGVVTFRQPPLNKINEGYSAKFSGSSCLTLAASTLGNVLNGRRYVSCGTMLQTASFPVSGTSRTVNIANGSGSTGLSIRMTTYGYIEAFARSVVGESIKSADGYPIEVDKVFNAWFYVDFEGDELWFWINGVQVSHKSGLGFTADAWTQQVGNTTPDTFGCYQGASDYLPANTRLDNCLVSYGEIDADGAQIPRGIAAARLGLLDHSNALIRAIRDVTDPDATVIYAIDHQGEDDGILADVNDVWHGVASGANFVDAGTKMLPTLASGIQLDFNGVIDHAPLGKMGTLGSLLGDGLVLSIAFTLDSLTGTRYLIGGGAAGADCIWMQYGDGFVQLGVGDAGTYSWSMTIDAPLIIGERYLLTAAIHPAAPFALLDHQFRPFDVIDGGFFTSATPADFTADILLGRNYAGNVADGRIGFLATAFGQVVTPSQALVAHVKAGVIPIHQHRLAALPPGVADVMA